MKVMCVDDNVMHLSLIQQQLKAAGKKIGKEIEIIGTANNGSDGFKLYQELLKKSSKPDFCTFDIRMPILDGLSTLMKMKHFYPMQKIIMVSSEDESTVSRKVGKASGIPQAEKMQLLKKVEARILADTIESGKISKILDACEELLLDPIDIAEHYKANGYLQKPYSLEATEKVLNGIVSGVANFIRAK